jgi:hypothetical protein
MRAIVGSVKFSQLIKATNGGFFLFGLGARQNPMMCE